jgi:hypothetical protein
MSNAARDRDERIVYQAIERLGGRNTGINELSISYACPSLDVYAVLRDLAERGVVERQGAGVRIVTDFSSSCPPTVQPEAAPVPAPEPRTRTRKPQFPSLSRDPRQAAREMAARIKSQVQHYGEDGRMSVSGLRRSLHAYRHIATWNSAIDLLVGSKQAIVANRSLTLLPTIEDRLPDPYQPDGKKTKKLRRKRKPSRWFEMNRHKMDLGQHERFHLDLTENEDAVEPWSEGAYWIEKSQSL